MPAEKITSFDGKTLIAVKFERQSPEASAPVIEVMFDIVEPDGIFGATVYVLELLSATRTDTREPVTLTPEEKESVKFTAADYAETLLKDD